MRLKRFDDRGSAAAAATATVDAGFGVKIVQHGRFHVVEHDPAGTAATLSIGHAKFFQPNRSASVVGLDLEHNVRVVFRLEERIRSYDRVLTFDCDSQLEFFLGSVKVVAQVRHVSGRHRNTRFVRFGTKKIEAGIVGRRFDAARTAVEKRKNLFVGWRKHGN